MPFLKRNDVSLYFEKTEGEAPPVVLIHGWCCDHTYFAPQAEHFAKLGHCVVAPDLRGHGRSDKPHQAYTMQVFADDVAWLCGELKLSKPILIGHSMGGIVAFDLAARYPDLPAAIVMLDSAVVLPAAARAGIPRFLETLRGPDYAKAVRDYVAAVLFIPTDDPARKVRILDSMAEAPQHMMISAYQGLAEYDAGEAKGPPCGAKPLRRRRRTVAAYGHRPPARADPADALRTDRRIGTLLPARSARPGQRHDRPLSEGGVVGRK